MDADTPIRRSRACISDIAMCTMSPNDAPKRPGNQASLPLARALRFSHVDSMITDTVKANLVIVPGKSRTIRGTRSSWSRATRTQ
jgi:hypothetical protein